MINYQERPYEKRFFVHKKLLGLGKFAVQQFVPGGSAGLAIASSLIGGRERQKSVAKMQKFGGDLGGIVNVARTVLGIGESRPGVCDSPRTRDPADGVCKFPGNHIATIRRQAASFSAGVPIPAALCIPPARIDPVDGKCRIFIGETGGADPSPGGNGAGAPGGPPERAVRVPQLVDGTKRRCPKRYVLGIDNLCYFGLARNSKWRKWRPGRRPAFTGGDLNAIARTAKLADVAEELFKDTNPAKKAVARSYRANWRKPLKK